MEAEYLQVLQSNLQNSDGSWPQGNLITVNQIMSQTVGSWVTMNNVNNKLGFQIHHSLRSGGGSVVEIDYPEYIGDASWNNRYSVVVQVTKESNANSKLAIRCNQSNQTNIDVLEDNLLAYTTSGLNMLNGFSGPLYREKAISVQSDDVVLNRFIVEVDTFPKTWNQRIEFYDYGDQPCRIHAVGIYICRYSDIGYTFADRYSTVMGTRTYNETDPQVW